MALWMQPRVQHARLRHVHDSALGKQIGGVTDGNLYEGRLFRMMDAPIFPMVPWESLQPDVCVVAERAADRIAKC